MARSSSRKSTGGLRSKVNRPARVSRKSAQSAELGDSLNGRVLDAVPDRIDIRDWPYQPGLSALPDTIVNCDRVPVILDQAREGACTGFALAAVINFLRFGQYERDSVSPRMLYEMARRYDKWPGEDYEGSSARGAMIGWVRHGVCSARSWPHTKKGPQHFTPSIAQESRRVPGGAFYRINHREVRDMHAALAEVGAVYMTLMVHDGWFAPGEPSVEINYAFLGRDRSLTLPVIQRKGRATSGHAVAIVGYTDEGFIIQNSWGETWGNGGFALLPYEDFMLHATDVWVAQVGVPVKIDLWKREYADSTEGLQRAQALIPLNEIRPFTVDLGNNGKLSDSGNYWTTRKDVDRLFKELIPDATRTWKRRRVLFYLHGGLNDEKAVARRIIAFRDVMLANEIYPVHIMWESGVKESISGIIQDLFTDEDERAGGIADWLQRTREGLSEAKDLTFELTAALPGGALWAEMKENARLASIGREAGLQIIAKSARTTLKRASKAERSKWELHVAGHSAGSIVAAHGLPLFCNAGIAFKTLQFMAPAMTVDLFKKSVMAQVKSKSCPMPTIYALSDKDERSDDVGPYGKSLLYLVSNAFEGRRGVALLGMQRYISKIDGKLDPDADPTVVDFLKDHIIVSSTEAKDGAYPLSRSSTHGGFDNDPATLNSMLWRVLGHEPQRPFTARDLQY